MNPQRLIAFTVALVALGTIASVISDTILTGWVPGYAVAVALALTALVLLAVRRLSQR